jgi:hypothetical protein
MTELSVVQQADGILSNLPSARWRVFFRRFDMDMDEITKDPVLMLWIMANEYQRSINGNKDEWERWEAMSLNELNEFLGLDVGDDDDSKSDEQPAG